MRHDLRIPSREGLATGLAIVLFVAVACSPGGGTGGADAGDDATVADLPADPGTDAVPDAGDRDLPAADEAAVPPDEGAGDPGDAAGGDATDPGRPDLHDAGPDLPGRTPDDCLAHTRDSKECKDCCDCLDVACEQIVACRDACPLHDFSGNGDFIAVSAPSELGAAGDYSACTSLATEQACKACCDCDDLFACGDQKYCRNACAGSAGWPPLDMKQIGTPVPIPGSFQFAEGPAWDAAQGALLFSDIDADTIYRLAPPSTVTVFRTPSHRANGLGFDTAGRLLAAEHQSRSVTRTAGDGTVSTLADAWDGQSLNSPNDLVVRSDGTIWFTDPTYGLGSTPSALGFTGLFRIDPAGALHLDAKVDGQPNGVALAPGEKTLYVAATTANKVLAFSVAADGTLSGQRDFATVDAPDGLAVDQAGNLYVAAFPGGQGAVVVLTSAGKTVGSLPLAQQPTNCGFGGKDGKTLYVTARTALYGVPVPIPGF